MDEAAAWGALAADAFGEAVLMIDETGARLAAGTSSFSACARALDVAPEPDAVISALAALGGAAAQALEALTARGRSCAFTVKTGSGAILAVEGLATGAAAWLRVSLRSGASGAMADLAAGLDVWSVPLGLIGADARIAWANRAWRAASRPFDPAVEDAVRQVLELRAGREITRRARQGESVGVMRTRIEPLAFGGAIAWTADVTAEAAAAATLARSDELYDLTLSGLSDAVAVFDSGQRLVRHNDAFARLWDLEPAWLAGRPRQSEWLDSIRANGRAPENADLAAIRPSELRRRDQRHDLVEALWRLPGERLLRLTGRPLSDGGMVLSFADVTARLAIESRFNQLVKVQQATLDKLTDAVAVFGADARLKLHNDAFANFWRLPAALLARAPAFDDLVEYCVARVHDLQFWRDLKVRIGDPNPALREALAGEVVTGDGRRVAWQSRPLPDGATLIGFSDITDTYTLQTALSEREAALEALSRLKRDFVGAVSRELRTPLTTVVGYAELLAQMQASLPEAQRGWVAAIGEASGALARLIDDILALAELDSGERRLVMSEVDLSDLLAMAYERWSPAALAAGVALKVAMGERPGSIRADAEALASVADHLIERALEETSAGGLITLEASRAMGEAVISVADTGRGIPFDVQARIFERFTGVEGAGAGLGLSLVKGLVELHGGWVFVESEPGRGARFSCHLPENARAAEDLPAAEEA